MGEPLLREDVIMDFVQRTVGLARMNVEAGGAGRN
jgi:hypothetical protein